MLIKNKKYHPVIYLILILYVNFFFLTPFFHQHEVHNSQSITTHSHIISDFIDHHHQENLNTNIDENHFHNYTLQEDYIHNPISWRLTKINASFKLTSNLVYPLKDWENQTTKASIPDYVFSLSWERYVQSATSVSPPLV